MTITLPNPYPTFSQILKTQITILQKSAFTYCKSFSINDNYLLDITKLIKKLGMAYKFFERDFFEEKGIGLNF